ncbi:MAG: hypothetical protein PHX18_00630 [Candidatus Gastranaerophilales bacterium]|nr:hypothetical protein [Candidatus Gastranaerophilales bacterium]
MNFNLKSFFHKDSQDKDIISNKHKSKKLFFSGHESLTISTSSEDKAKKITELTRNILKKYMNKPNLILKFMEAKGTKIVLAAHIAPVLKLLKYEEGFIPSHKGFGAFILNFAVELSNKEKPSFSFIAPDMFISIKKDVSLYLLAHHFHHWMAYQNQLPGYETDALCIFRHVINEPNPNFSSLSINEILSLKDVIERDKEAVEFVQEFVREHIGAKEKLTSALNGENIKI